MINAIVASWEFGRGVEVDSPISGWGMASKRLRPEVSTSARARLFFLRRDEDSLSFSSISSNRICSIGIFDVQKSFLLFGFAESTASGWSLRDLDNGGECEECHSPPI